MPLPFIVGAGVMLIAIGIVVAFVKEPDLFDQPAGEREPGLWANVKHVATDREPERALPAGRVILCVVRGVECDRGVRPSRCMRGTYSAWQWAPACRC